jgi:hypothetical protein
LGLNPATMTLMTSSSGPGVGMGTSWIEVCNSGLGLTITSFIFALLRGFWFLKEMLLIVIMCYWTVWLFPSIKRAMDEGG